MTTITTRRKQHKSNEFNSSKQTLNQSFHNINIIAKPCSMTKCHAMALGSFSTSSESFSVIQHTKYQCYHIKSLDISYIYFYHLIYSHVSKGGDTIAFISIFHQKHYIIPHILRTYLKEEAAVHSNSLSLFNIEDNLVLKGNEFVLINSWSSTGNVSAILQCSSTYFFSLLSLYPCHTILLWALIYPITTIKDLILIPT